MLKIAKSRLNNISQKSLNAVLVIGETNQSKEKVLKYYQKIFPFLKEVKSVFSTDLLDSDLNHDWNISILNSRLYNYKFDIIIANNVLEHILNLQTFMLNVKRCLLKNGFLIIRTDNALYFPFYIPLAFKPFGIGYHAGYYNKMYNPRDDDNHYHIFTKSHLVALLKRFNFKILELHYGVYKYGIKHLPISIAPRILVLARNED